MPTTRGWTVLGTSVALLAVGVAFGYRELAAVGLVGTVAVLLAVGWVGLPPRLAVDRAVEPDRVTRGEACRAVLDLHTAARGTRVLNVADRIRGPVGESIVAVGPVRVRGGLPARSEYDLPTDRRGLLMVGPLWVGRRDLFGLCATYRSVGEATRLLVRPRWHSLSGLPFGASPSLNGVADAALRGSIAFHTLREYQFGDDLRHVHWRTSARTNTLMVRENIDTAQPKPVLLVDDRAESYLDDADAIEYVVEAAASILVAAGRAGLPLDLRLASGQRSAGGTGPGLDLLAQARPTSEVTMATTMRQLRLQRAGDTLVVVTGPGADLRPAIAARGAYTRIVLVVVGRTGAVTAGPAGVTVLAVPGIADFVSAWNRMLW